MDISVTLPSKRASFRDILDSLTVTQRVNSCWQVFVTDGGVPTDEWRVVDEATDEVVLTCSDPAPAVQYRQTVNEQRPPEEDTLILKQPLDSVPSRESGVPRDEWRVVDETTGTVAATADNPAQAAEYRKEMNDQLTRQEVFVLRQPLEDVPNDEDG
jgi:hypothetical protein